MYYSNDANDTFSAAQYSSYNSSIAIARMLLAFYVLFYHIIPRYAFYGHDVHYLLNLEFFLIKLFQPSGETNPAVIAFLTISGYCIHRNGLRQNNMDFKAFAINRAFRILPILLLGTLLGIVVFHALKTDLKIIVITNTSDITFFSAIYKVSGLFAFIPYKFEQLSHQGNSPLITCIVELWLYAAYPLLAIFIIKHGTKLFWSLLGAITLTGTIMYTIFPSIASWWHNGSFLGFLIYWWIGVYAVDRQNRFFAGKTRNIVFAFLAMSLILIFYPKIFLVAEIKKVLLAILVAVFLRQSEYWSTTDFGKTFFASGYSLYALHVPLICVALFFNINIYIAIFAILMISYLSYLYFEAPLLAMGKSLGFRSVFSRVKMAISQ